MGGPPAGTGARRCASLGARAAIAAALAQTCGGGSALQLHPAIRAPRTHTEGCERAAGPGQQQAAPSNMHAPSGHARTSSPAERGGLQQQQQRMVSKPAEALTKGRAPAGEYPMASNKEDDFNVVVKKGMLPPAPGDHGNIHSRECLQHHARWVSAPDRGEWLCPVAGVLAQLSQACPSPPPSHSCRTTGPPPLPRRCRRCLHWRARWARARAGAPRLCWPSPGRGPPPHRRRPRGQVQPATSCCSCWTDPARSWPGPTPPPSPRPCLRSLPPWRRAPWELACTLWPSPAPGTAGH
jgi:hypothetical protein